MQLMLYLFFFLNLTAFIYYITTQLGDNNTCLRQALVKNCYSISKFILVFAVILTTNALLQTKYKNVYYLMQQLTMSIIILKALPFNNALKVDNETELRYHQNKIFTTLTSVYHIVFLIFIGEDIFGLSRVNLGNICAWISLVNGVSIICVVGLTIWMQHGITITSVFTLLLAGGFFLKILDNVSLVGNHFHQPFHVVSLIFVIISFWLLFIYNLSFLVKFVVLTVSINKVQALLAREKEEKERELGEANVLLLDYHLWLREIQKTGFLDQNELKEFQQSITSLCARYKISSNFVNWFTAASLLVSSNKIFSIIKYFNRLKIR